jgi:hypothetical protein
MNPIEELSLARDVVSTWIELKNEHFRTVRDAMEWAESMADAHQCFINRMKYQRENQK